MKDVLSFGFKAALRKPLRLITVFLVAVITFTGIRILGLRSFIQYGQNPGIDYFSFNVWMLLAAIPLLVYFAASTVLGAREEIAAYKGTPAWKVFFALALPMLLTGLAVTVVSNNLYRLYALYIYNAHHGAFVTGLFADGLRTFEHDFNYETFTLTLLVPMGTLLAALAATFLLREKLPAAKEKEARLAILADPFRLAATFIMGVVAFYGIANCLAAPDAYPDAMNRPDFSFAYFLLPIAAAYFVYLAFDTVTREREDLLRRHEDGESAAKLWLREFVPFAVLAVAVSAVAFAGHAWYLFRNGKFAPHSGLTISMTIPPYAPNAASWLVVFLVPLAVFALATLAATLFVLRRKQPAAVAKAES